jgi:hypothetical protein
MSSRFFLIPAICSDAYTCINTSPEPAVRKYTGTNTIGLNYYFQQLVQADKTSLRVSASSLIIVLSYPVGTLSHHQRKHVSQNQLPF